MMIRTTAVFAAMFALATSTFAQDVSLHGKGVSVNVSPAGTYVVVTESPAWEFSGTFAHKLDDVHQTNGSDALGAYTAAEFKWDADGPKTGEIRSYADRPIVQFIQTFQTAQAKPPAPFPTLHPPKGLALFSYADNTFAPARFRGQPGGTPWLMFDRSGHAAILSPASHFMIANLHSQHPTTAPIGIESGTVGTPEALRELTDAPIESGFMDSLANLPEHFSQSTVLCFGDGIGETFNSWGTALTDLTGKKRPANDADASLKYFGYWTDNGATYYYNYDRKLGYANTLLAVKKAFADLNIPLGYLQLDSWWYKKTSLNANGKLGNPYKNADLPRGSWNCYGGLTEYTAHPDLFPKGLADFHESIGLPFITHNRWVDLNSPYRQKYRISGVGAIDPKWWDDLAIYIHSSGVMTYEQDWLDQIYKYSPEFASTTTAGDAFMDNMARACAEKGITLQYCMGLARNYLQGTKYNNLTTVRVNGDRFERRFWEPALYVSAMASALGEWPWVDTFMSKETPNLILATLTAGAVGVGDPIDGIDRENIMKSIRADGVIVKPDSSIVPTDATFIADAANQNHPVIAAAYTNHGAHRTGYVFAFPRNERQTKIDFWPADLGFAGDTWVYDTQAKTGKRIATKESFTASFAETNAKTAWAYYIVAPVTPAGLAIVGDAGKFASMGRQRIADLIETPDGAKLKVAFAPGDAAVDLLGFAAAAPNATLADGSKIETSFDASSSQFHTRVNPPVGGAGEVEVQLQAEKR